MLGETESKRRTRQRRMRWLGGITDSVDMDLSKLWEMGEDSGAWHAAVHGVTKSRTWQWLNNDDSMLNIVDLLTVSQTALMSRFLLPLFHWQIESLSSPSPTGLNPTTKVNQGGHEWESILPAASRKCEATPFREVERARRWGEKEGIAKGWGFAKAEWEDEKLECGTDLKKGSIRDTQGWKEHRPTKHELNRERAMH